MKTIIIHIAIICSLFYRYSHNCLIHDLTRSSMKCVYLAFSSIIVLCFNKRTYRNPFRHRQQEWCYYTLTRNRLSVTCATATAGRRQATDCWGYQSGQTKAGTSASNSKEVGLRAICAVKQAMSYCYCSIHGVATITKTPGRSTISECRRRGPTAWMGAAVRE